MVATINKSSGGVRPVVVNFFWNENGREEKFTYDGEPYTRKTTNVALPVEFFATTHTPKVETPPGVVILEYIWNFGDGSKGFGPSVTHEYQVTDQDLPVDLIVVDSLHRRWSSSKPISLVTEAIGRFATYKIRAENARSGKQVLFREAGKIKHRKPGKKESATEDEILPGGIVFSHTGAGHLAAKVTTEDESLTKDSTIERGRGHRKHVNELEKEKVLTEDIATRVFVQNRTATDTSATSDAVVRATKFNRVPTEKALAADAITEEKKVP